MYGLHNHKLTFIICVILGEGAKCRNLMLIGGTPQSIYCDPRQNLKCKNNKCVKIRGCKNPFIK